MAAAALIAKAILGAIGGGFEGAAKPYTGTQTGIKANDTGADKVSAENDGEKKVTPINSDSLSNEKLTNIQEAAKVNDQQGMDLSKAQSAFQNKDSYKQAFGGFSNNLMNNSGMSAAGNTLGSDVELKKIYGDDLADNLIENFAKINAIDFKYTPEAQKEYNGANSVDDKEHIGIKAQELESNPATIGTVETDINGNKVVNTQHLTAANTAVIAELSRRILTLEMAIEELRGMQNG